uniref:D,D-heptose 1,7-bisphosphate phosphatase n=1 Tax=mine drainage metagenome TaxID=410659 RepID=E6PM40_9ZZZZ
MRLEHLRDNGAMKLIILDRDGVINEDRDDFIKSPDEWLPIAGSLDAIARLHREGWRVVVASNQSGIGRGLFDMATLNAIHLKMNKALAAAGGRIDAIFFCPHAPEDHCHCRKPKPGMFQDIATRYGLDDLSGVPAVGDTLRDLQAAQPLGCSLHLVRSGKGGRTLASETLPEGALAHDNLAAFATWLLAEPVKVAA